MTYVKAEQIRGVGVIKCLCVYLEMVTGPHQPNCNWSRCGSFLLASPGWGTSLLTSLNTQIETRTVTKILSLTILIADNDLKKNVRNIKLKLLKK